MPRRCNDSSLEGDPPKKRNCNNFIMSSFDFKYGEVLKDVTGKQWKLGKAIGIGGFGEIYLASDNLSKEVQTNCNYVAKIESHKNGPLFVEMNCYLRIAKPDMIEEWKKQKRMSSLGMPHYVASGSHMHKGEKYRFLILPKFDKDLEKILEKNKMLSLKTVLTISQQIIDVLEYIHSKGYIHSDIKASNLLLTSDKNMKQFESPRRPSTKFSYSKPVRSCRIMTNRSTRILRSQPHVNYIDDIPNFDQIISDGISDENSQKPKCKKDQVYLLDYGLACKYRTSDGEHKPYCADERKAHAGTILFCSRDAHRGAQARRSDLESLGYNIIYWLTGNLPWSDDVADPELVHKKKQIAMTDIEYFLRSCFTEYPTFLEDYFKYLQNLQFQEKPDYNYCKNLFKQSIKASGYKDDAKFDFDPQSKRPKQFKAAKRVSENLKVRKFVQKIPRPPLQSNIPVKPLLRKKVKNKRRQNKNKWFEDLTDPEEILKQAREKRNTEHNDSNFTSNIAELNIRTLNPTYAMIEIYNKCRERIETLPSCKGDSFSGNLSGYTHAMMSVLRKIKKRKEVESEEMAVSFCKTRSGKNIRRCISKRRKKFESPAKAPPQTRTTKSTIALKKEGVPGRRAKTGVLRRSYSLRG